MTAEYTDPVTHGEFQEAIAIVKEDIANIKGDIVNMKDDIVNMKGDIVNMKGDIASMKSNIEGVKEDIASLRIEFKSEVKWIGGIIFALNLIVFSGLVHIALTRL